MYTKHKRCCFKCNWWNVAVFSWNKFVTKKIVQTCKYVLVILLLYFIFHNCVAINWNLRQVLLQTQFDCELQTCGVVWYYVTMSKPIRMSEIEHAITFSFAKFQFCSTGHCAMNDEHCAPLKFVQFFYKKFDRIFILIQCFVITRVTFEVELANFYGISCSHRFLLRFTFTFAGLYFNCLSKYARIPRNKNRDTIKRKRTIGWPCR